MNKDCRFCNKITPCFYHLCGKNITHSYYCKAINDFLEHEKIDMKFDCTKTDNWWLGDCNECRKYERRGPDRYERVCTSPLPSPDKKSPR